MFVVVVVGVRGVEGRWILVAVVQVFSGSSRPSLHESAIIVCSLFGSFFSPHGKVPTISILLTQ